MSLFLSSLSVIGPGPETDTCREALAARAQGAPLVSHDVRAVPCDPDRTKLAVVYDRHDQQVRAGVDIEPGDYLGPLALRDVGTFVAGDTLLLTVDIGPVRIERIVWAAQPSRGHEEIFVRDEAGSAFAVPVAALSRTATQ